MFDFGRITELAGGFLGQQVTEPASNVLEQLLGNNVDLSQLQDLSSDQMLGFLSEHGIDPSQLDTEQLGTLLEHADIEATPEALSQLLERFNA